MYHRKGDKWSSVFWPTRDYRKLRDVRVLKYNFLAFSPSFFNFWHPACKLAELWKKFEFIQNAVSGSREELEKAFYLFCHIVQICNAKGHAHPTVTSVGVHQNREIKAGVF